MLFCVESFVEIRLSFEYELPPGLEGELVHAEVPEEGAEGEIYNLGQLGLRVKDQGRKRGSLKRMPLQDSLKDLEAFLGKYLPLQHVLKQKVHNREEGRGLLIRESILLAELIVDVVEVKHYLLLLNVCRWGLPLKQTEYLCDHLPLLLVGLCLL